MLISYHYKKKIYILPDVIKFLGNPEGKEEQNTGGVDSSRPEGP